jgi:hypothetical protein
VGQAGWRLDQAISLGPKLREAPGHLPGQPLDAADMAAHGRPAVDGHRELARQYMRARVRRSASPAPSRASPKPMQAHRFSPVKGSVFPDPLDDEVLDTELGAEGDSVGVLALELVEVPDDDVLAVVVFVFEWEWPDRRTASCRPSLPRHRPEPVRRPAASGPGQ